MYRNDIVIYSPFITPVTFLFSLSHEEASWYGYDVECDNVLKFKSIHPFWPLWKCNCYFLLYNSPLTLFASFIIHYEFNFEVSCVSDSLSHNSLDLYIIIVSTSGIYWIAGWWIVTCILHFSFSIILKQSTFTNTTANWVITKPTTHKLHNYTTLLLETNASSPNGSFNGSRLKEWRYTSMVTLGLNGIDPLKALIADTNSTPWYLYETLHESVLSSITDRKSVV